MNDAVKLFIHSDPPVLDDIDHRKLRIKHNMNGTIIGALTNFLVSTITCIESGAKQQTAPNIISLGQFKFDKENRAEIERVIPDDFINMMEKRLVFLKGMKCELEIQMPLDMKMMWQVMGLYGITGNIHNKL